MKSYHLLAVGALVALLGLVGCGGGSGGAGNVPGTIGDAPGSIGGGRESNLGGGLSAQLLGDFKPVNAGNSNTVITGIAGGTISSAHLRDATPTLAETLIIFQRKGLGDGTGTSLFAMNADGTDQRLLVPNAFAPAATLDGKKIAFVDRNRTPNGISVLSLEDGSLIRVTEGNNHNRPAWSPNGQQIAYDDGADIFLVNATAGATPTKLRTDTATETSPAWSPAGRHIVFVRIPPGQADTDIFVQEVGNPASLKNLVEGNTPNDSSPAWSPDGTELAWTQDGGNIIIGRFPAGNPDRLTDFRTIDLPGTTFFPSWSPDSSKIVFRFFDAPLLGIGTVNRDGTGRVTLSSNPTQFDEDPTWSGFLTQRTLIGTGGNLGTQAAGLFFGREGDIIQSVVGFDAQNRDSATINLLSNLALNPPNFVFELRANSLTNLSFVNGPLSKQTPTRVIGGGGGNPSSATVVLLDFNAKTGRVTTVLPLAGTRAASESASASAVTEEGSARILRGPFLGAWDGSGKNHAPNGATEVRIDKRTGAIIGVK
jgi:hypothetical protein